MSLRLVQTQIDKIIDQLAVGLSLAHVVAIESVNKKTVQRIKINNQAFNSRYPSRLTTEHGKKTLSVAMEDALLEYLTGRLDEFCDK